jgi:hypothetical protein
MRHGILILAAVLVCAAAHATEVNGFDVSVLTSDVARPEYHHDGRVYIEAIRGREFAIRLTNPTPNRVAVALSVDGLNTIDARHTDPWSAAKWVLGPYESTQIFGWQVNDATARHFVFTGEKSSYGAFLGKTENLGVIEAVFYAERQRPVARREMQAPAAPSEKANAAGSAGLSDDYAATGMGDRERHEVERVAVDLDPHPIASARIRYEFRAQLVKLGVIPDSPTAIERREHARGFERYCPEMR